MRNNEVNLSEYVNLINNFIDSKAFEKNSYDLMSLLKENHSLPDSISYHLCETYTNYLESIESREYIGYSVNTKEVFAILLNIYNGSKRNKDFQTKCLNLIDRIWIIDSYSTEQAMKEYER